MPLLPKKELIDWLKALPENSVIAAESGECTCEETTGKPITLWVMLPCEKEDGYCRFPEEKDMNGIPATFNVPT